MKIIDKRNDALRVEAKDIDVGEVFEYGGCFFMRIPNHNTDDLLTIRLDTNKVLHFGCQTNVVKLKCHLVIEN